MSKIVVDGNKVAIETRYAKFQVIVEEATGTIQVVVQGAGNYLTVMPVTRDTILVNAFSNR